MTDRELVSMAEEAMSAAYAPYSGFKVGAALAAHNAKGEIRVFTGCNIENASYSPTICAERAAAAEAVKNGFTHFETIAVCVGKDGSIEDFCPPCGVCRQVLCEFGTDDAVLILWDGKKTYRCTFGEMLPLSFRKNKLL